MDICFTGFGFHNWEC